MLSAFLATVRILPRANEINAKEALKLYLDRVLRLAPIYYAAFMIGWLVVPFFREGPVWYAYEKCFQDCQNYWWSVFTFTINFWPAY